MRAAWAYLPYGGMIPRLLLARDLLDEVDDATAQLAVLDAHERLRQRQPVGGCEEVGDVGRRRCFAHAGEAGRARRARGALEEEGDRDLQDVRNLLQPAGADAVRAFLVFLYLLERQPNGLYTTPSSVSSA